MKINCFTCLFLLNFTGQIPVVTLNFAALAFETPFNRDSVEGCVKEVLNALARSVGARRNVEFTFTGIGRLQIRDSKVKMKFYKEFVNSMDGSGKIVETMVNVSECFCSFLLIDQSIRVEFWHRRSCSTSYKCRTGIQYPTLVIDPRRYFNCMSP